MSRTTKEGRKLTYQLKVIQQPERARACGSGAKCKFSPDDRRCKPGSRLLTWIASADRRPVDPPPVVELRIFEGDSMNDITFSHNANFMLFASLESARPIAQGRVPQTPASFPVLTGIPVSSMAYLDRPSPAGYFIFPDLSVRHEGKYKLAFTLYEEVKEAKDADVEPALNHPDHPKNKHIVLGPYAPKEWFHWRLEVQSAAFSVYSAKKFPGLAESTALSRIVAEQGCRVRIRRDVRMRRRENKNKDYDEYGEETMYTPVHEAATPDAYRQHTPMEAAERQRSVSNASIDRVPQYPMEHRPSVPEGHYAQPQYQQQAYAPNPAPQNGPPNYLAFGNAASQQYQAPQAPQYPPPISQAVPQHQMHPEPHYGYPPQGHQARPMSSSQPYYAPERQYSYQAPQPPPQHPQPQPGHARVDSNDSSMHDYRRHSSNYADQYHVKPAQPSAYGYPQPHPQPQPQSSYGYQPAAPVAARPSTPAQGPSSLPPLKVPNPIEPKYEDAVTSSTLSSARPPPVHSSVSYDSGLSKAPQYGQYSAPPSAIADPVRSGKRAFSSAFEASHLDQPLTNGMRPSEATYGADAPQTEFDEDSYDTMDIEAMKMQYKRADGTEILRRLPVVR